MRFTICYYVFCSCFFLFCFFFFFQAEDGIRDLIVTGVQTCALPISPCARAILMARTSSGVSREFPLRFHACPDTGMRSEERRVGKSVDLGGRRIIKKKKKKKKSRSRGRKK